MLISISMKELADQHDIFGSNWNLELTMRRSRIVERQLWLVSGEI